MQLQTGLKLFLGMVLICTVAMFFYGATHPLVPPATDRYGCVPGHVPAAHMVLVDTTDKYSAGQVEQVKKEFAGIPVTVEPGDLLIVARIGGELPADIIFQACSPPKGEVPGFFQSLWQDQDKDWLQIRQQYEESFQRPIEKLAGDLPLTQTTKYSPIIQSMAYVMTELGTRWSQVKKRRITIISDLLENTKAFTQYDKENATKPFSEVRDQGQYIRDTPLDLASVSVTVIYLTGFHGDRGFQGAEHLSFWTELVKFYGGTIVDWIGAPGNDGVSQ